jgi:hypothetical protein
LKDKFNELNEMVKQMKKKGDENHKSLKEKLDDTNEELVKKSFELFE